MKAFIHSKAFLTIGILCILYGSCESVNAKNIKYDVKAREEASLFEAIDRGDFRKIRALIHAGVSVNAVDADGTTAAVRASYLNYYSIVELLLESGADPMIENRWGFNLVDAVRQFGDKGMSIFDFRNHKAYVRVVKKLKARGLFD